MNFQVKILLAVGVVMLGLAIVLTEVEGQSTTPDLSMLCNRTQYNLTGTPKIDSCINKQVGVKYKSCSFCWVNNVTSVYNYRYDFYVCQKCVPSGSLCIAKLNCTGIPPVYINNYTDIYNPFDSASQRCITPTIQQNATVPPTPCT